MTAQIKWTFLAAVVLPLVMAGALQIQSASPAGQNPGKVVHVVVALCDNQYQGIVPVPARIGDGDDPANNLYWGAAYGVRTFFRKSKEWRLLSETKNPAPGVLERVIFRNDQRNVFLVADAYRGREIQRATQDFLKFAAGQSIQKIEARAAAERWTLHAGGGADLVAYVGHDGLMDFSLPDYPRKADGRKRQAILLACASKVYFKGPLQRTGAEPLLWTTGLMAPEAYVLHAALDAWSRGENGEAVRQRAAEAYHKYQKCGLSAARRLFVTGW